MSTLRAEISMSVDGFVAGPNPSLEDPLGVGGEQLHDWALKLAVWRRAHGLGGGEGNVSTEGMEESLAAQGAVVMGRKMFSGGGGAGGGGLGTPGGGGGGAPGSFPRGGVAPPPRAAPR